MSLLILFHTSGAAPPATPQIGNPIGLLLALTYSEGGTPEPPAPSIGSDTYYYSPSKAATERMYRALFGDRTPRKKKRKAKLEQVALQLMREFDPGPDLPPIDLSALVAAIRLLDAPVNLKPTAEQKSEIIEALLTKAQQIREDDEEILEMAQIAMLN